MDNDKNLVQLETNIDDLNPQVYEYVIDLLLAAGALDVWLVPIIMKKSRPAVTLCALVDTVNLERITAIIFKETTAIGVRYCPVNRITAERKIVTVETDWGTASVKVSLHNGTIVNIMPEYADCRRLAEMSGKALKIIQQVVGEKAGKIVKGLIL